MTPVRHSRADELAALMIYQAGLPFGFFEKPEIIIFLQALNSVYTSPKRNILATTMLDKTLTAVKQEVNAEINKEEKLNVCFNGVFNINY
jgi:hypothetical protein